MKELTIQDIFAILLKWIALILIAPVVVSAIVGVYFYTSVPNTFEASTMLYVLYSKDGSNESTSYDPSSSAQYATDYQTLIQAHEITDTTAQKLGLEELDVEISVKTAGTGTTSRVLNLSCSGTDAKMCADAANTIGDVFAEYMNDKVGFNAVRVFSYAEIPESPSGPHRLRTVAIAFIATFAVCCGIALAVEMLNTTFKTENEVEEVLETSVLASIEGYRVELDKYRAAPKGDTKSIFRSVNEITRESIKTLATNIQFCAKSQTIKSLTITSTQPSEGKTSVSIMLASALAEEGKKVLIVDMDFRNPYVGKLLKRRSDCDLVNYFNGEKDLTDVITPTNTNGLFFIDSFHRNTISANIIRIDAFDQFVKDVTAVFDIVIFDTPPVGLYVDAAVLSAKTNATLMVVGCGVTSREAARDSMAQLKKANANLIGVAFNFVQMKPGRGYNYYRYYKHYQYKNYHIYSNPNRREGRHAGEKWGAEPEVVSSRKRNS